MKPSKIVFALILVNSALIISTALGYEVLPYPHFKNSQILVPVWLHIILLAFYFFLRWKQGTLILNPETNPDSSNPASGSLSKSGRFLIIIWISLTLLTLFIYSDSFSGYYFWDDWRYQRYGREITGDFGIEAITEFLFRYSTGFLRPLAELFSGVDYALFKFSPFGSHIISMLIHSFNGLLIGYLVLIISRSRFLSLISGILFILHPINAGQIVHICNRAYPLSVTFYLISMALYLNYVTHKTSNIFYIFSILSQALSMLTLEIGVTLFLCIIVLDLFFNSRFRSAKLKRLLLQLPYILITALYFYWRYRKFGPALGGYGTHTVFNLHDVFYRFSATLPHVLLLPLNQLWIEKTPFPIVFSAVKFMIVTACILVSLILTFRKNLFLKGISLGLGMIFIGILPLYNYVGGNIQFLERARDFYLPSTGFTIFLASFIFYPWQGKNKKRIYSICFLFLISIVCIMGIRKGTFEWNAYGRMSKEIVQGIDPHNFTWEAFGSLNNDFMDKNIEMDHGAPGHIPPWSNLFFMRFTPMASGFVDLFFRDWVYTLNPFQFYHFKPNITIIDRDGNPLDFDIRKLNLLENDYLTLWDNKDKRFKVVNFLTALKLLEQELMAQTGQFHSLSWNFANQEDLKQWSLLDQGSFISIKDNDFPALFQTGHNVILLGPEVRLNPLHVDHLEIILKVDKLLQPPEPEFFHGKIMWEPSLNKSIPDFDLDNEMIFPLQIKDTPDTIKVFARNSLCWLLCPEIQRIKFIASSIPIQVELHGLIIKGFDPVESIKGKTVLTDFFLHPEWTEGALKKYSGTDPFIQHILQGMVLSNTEKYEGAATEFREASKIAPGSLLPEFMQIINGSRNAYSSGMKSKAITMLEDSHKKYPEFLPFLFLLGKFYKDSGIPGMALQFIQKILDQTPFNFDANYSFASLCENLRHHDEAQEYFQRSYFLKPYSREGKIALNSLDSFRDKDGTYLHHQGYSFIFDVDPVFEMYDNTKEYKTKELVLYEDGVPLKYPKCLHHESIKKTGHGRYGHVGARIYFSTSDNSDPNTNGREYYFKIKYAKIPFVKDEEILKFSELESKQEALDLPPKHPQ